MSWYPLRLIRFPVALLLATTVLAENGGSREAGVRSLVTGGSSTITHTVELPQGSTEHDLHCAVDISISYTQMVDQVRIISSIEISSIKNADCAASSGEYVLQLRTRGDNGEGAALEFSETWGLTSNSSIELEKYYIIGDQSELLGARIRRASCRCEIGKIP